MALWFVTNKLELSHCLQGVLFSQLLVHYVFITVAYGRWSDFVLNIL